MNFVRDIVEAADPASPALIALAADGSRATYRYGDVADRAARMAGALTARGVGRGDVVMTLIGSRVEWIDTMLACFRIGAVALPCTEQLRAKDLAFRLAATEPVLVVCDERDLPQLRAAGAACDVLTVPDAGLLEAAPAPAADLGPADPCLITFTSGTSGEPKAVLHGQRYLAGQSLQAEHWMAARAGDVVWCTAASGWSKSARNVFIAPWLRGATALIQDARFDPDERLRVIDAESVSVLCMSPTEYRTIAKRAELRQLPSIRRMLAAGEALDAEVLRVWKDATGVEILDGYGQTETGQLTGMPSDVPARPGSMGKPLPGVGLTVVDGELVLDPATDPTFFLGYLGEDPPTGPWRTGDRVREEDGYLYFEGRTDDVIISSGYRIGPAEVESALISHPAVADVAVVAAPDEERGSVVRAVIVLTDGVAGSAALRAELQEHAKTQTAPYKYPRIVEFVDAIPRTASGKIRRAVLRGDD
jgi:acetyl-CoA synthetase